VSSALVRYLASDVARSQRWIAPAVLFVAAVAILNADAGPLLTTYADTATCLLPVAIWLTVVVANSEDPTQAAITSVTVGGTTRLRIGKLLVAFLADAGLALVAVLVPVILQTSSGGTTVGDVAAGAVAHLLVAATGVAVGAWLARPLVGRAGWVFVIGVLVVLAQTVVPHAPPTRQVLVLFDQDHPAHLAASSALIGIETIALVLVLTVGALALARARS
jgi:hypothetical protein